MWTFVFGILVRVGEPAQFRIFPDQRRWGRHSFSRDHSFQLQRVDAGLAFKMVVGDDVGRLGFLGDVFDSFLPANQLLFVVEIVVAVVAVIEIEPLIVVPSVQANVGNRCGDVLGRGERTSENRLIDIAETDVLVRERGQCFRVVPTLVAHFHYPRIFDELMQQTLEIFPV